MISVIVVTYNQEKTIGRTLDSILRQEWSGQLEIVIGEDCSADATADICRDYARRYPNVVRLFCNERNKGLVDNYFDCLLQCRGEFIADCAGDDFWTDSLKLRKEVEVLESHDEVMLVHTAWSYYDEATGQTTPAVIPFTQPFTAGRDMLTAIITQTSQPVIHLCTALYRKDVVMKAYEADPLSFRNKSFGCEDMQVCAALAAQGDIAFLPDNTLNYSVGRPSVSVPKEPAQLFSFTEGAANLSYHLARQYGIDNQLVDRHLGFRLYELAMHAFRAHDRQLRKKTQERKMAWNAKPTWRYRIVRLVTSNELTWRGALLLRGFYKNLRKTFANG